MSSKVTTDMDITNSIKEISEALGLTTRRINQLTNAGILPRQSKRGCYDLAACTRAYAEYQRKELRQLRATKAKRKSFFWQTVTKKETKKDEKPYLSELDKTLREMSERMTA